MGGQASLGKRLAQHHIEDAIAEIDASPDPDDNLILGVAIAGNADLIVSGDKDDMLALRTIEGIDIVNAAAAWKRISD